jgi:hypothetical protein
MYMIAQAIYVVFVINYPMLSVSVFNCMYAKVIYWKLVGFLVSFDVLIVVVNGAYIFFI